jgi:hypothetical protein
MVAVTKVEPLSDTDPWRIGAPFEINYHIAVQVPKIHLRTRVVITDVADDLPLVENLYLLNAPHTLTEGDHVLKVFIPPIHLRSGTYTCKFEIYEDETEMLLVSAEPIMLSSKRRMRHKESAYMRHTRLQVTVVSDADTQATA